MGEPCMMDTSSAGKNGARSQLRSRVGIAAQVFDPDGEDRFYCLILDASNDGCRIFCDHVSELPEIVHLEPEQLGKPIKASVRWRKQMTAGLKLDWADTLPQQASPD